MVRTAVAVIGSGRARAGRLAGLDGATGFDAIATPPGPAALDLLRARDIDIALLDDDGAAEELLLETARQIRKVYGRMPLALMTESSSEELAIAALRAGIDEYIRGPVSPQQLCGALRECIRRSRERFEYQRTVPGTVDGGMIFAPGSPMSEAAGYLARVAATDMNVLITGETGTGKELAARFIHLRSARRNKRLESLNCAAIPDGLLESELFGYERGAFTGAHAAMEGKLHAADGGTVFFDEIGDMSPYAQAKILRAIETREIQRLGGTRVTPLNIRIIAATNRDLESLVEAGAFRRDLYFRLNVARVHIPALRDRKEDIPVLLAHYLGELNARYGRAVRRFSEDVLDAFLGYAWPGNIRELRNVLEAAFVEVSSSEIQATDLPALFRRKCDSAAGREPDERSRLIAALLATNWNKSRTADKLRWSRMTVYRKMARYNLRPGQPADLPGVLSRTAKMA
ncbi:MAG TPA: sigma-54 dependent transcriptional regulator [Bryobacteraceae bacterium]|nr:sigma-54 dependent transcriptional regulator [Bryobacteraceae bacterium]